MPADARRPGLPPLLWPLTLGALVAAVYLPVLTHDFVFWDDPINVTQNPLLGAPWSAEVWKTIFVADVALRFEPAHWLLFRAVYALGGLHPSGWHALGLGLHVVAALLFRGILVRAARRFAPAASERAVQVAAWLGAAAWALHPLRVEPVAWVTASTYPQATVCLLASFSCYLEWGGDPEGKRRWWWAAWLLALAAYASYPVSLTYGLWLAAVDVWWFRLVPAGAWSLKQPDGRRWLGRMFLFLFPAALALGMTMASRFFHPGVFNSAPELGVIGPGLRLGFALAGLFRLAADAVWFPSLSPNHGMLPLEDVRTIATYAMAAVAAGTLAWAEWRRRQSPGCALVVLGMAGLALPCLGLTEWPMWPVDRYAYAVQLILFGGVTLAALRGLGGRPGLVPLLALGGVLTAAGLATATRQQLPVWRNTDTLFAHIERQPGFDRDPAQQAHIYLLWAAHARLGGDEEGARARLGQAYRTYTGGIAAAVERRDFRGALELSAQLGHHYGFSAALRRDRGAWWLELDQPAQALAELKLALELEPGDARTRALLARAERGGKP